MHPPVWWKTGEAAPDWPENEAVKDRPLPSGRFEADPLRDDCKEQNLWQLKNHVFAWNFELEAQNLAVEL